MLFQSMEVRRKPVESQCNNYSRIMLNYEVGYLPNGPITILTQALRPSFQPSYVGLSIYKNRSSIFENHSSSMDLFTLLHIVFLMNMKTQIPIENHSLPKFVLTCI